MNKQEAGLLGSSLVTIAIFAYGIKNKMGWKYWLFTLLFLPTAGAAIGIALGKNDPYLQKQIEEENNFNRAEREKEACRKRECKDKGGTYMNGQCTEKGQYIDGHLQFPAIELTDCK